MSKLLKLPVSVSVDHLLSKLPSAAEAAVARQDNKDNHIFRLCLIRGLHGRLGWPNLITPVKYFRRKHFKTVRTRTAVCARHKSSVRAFIALIK